MRQESINVPIKGIMTDYAVDAMPDNALSDCLNGTVITYNGNEMILQNDKGNIPLKGCTLNRDFMPVGIASYGDVLYIASYNPITKEFELGSYPSPINTVGSDVSFPGEDTTFLENVFMQFIENLVTYNQIHNDKYHKTYTNADWFLNPGDQYNVDGRPIESKYLYESLHFYILDNTNVLHDVTEYVNKDFPYSEVQNPEYKYVRWPYAGRLTYGWEVPGMNTFDGTIGIVHLPKIAIDKDGKKSFTDTKGDISLSFQFVPSDNIDLWKQAIDGDDVYIK